MQMARFGRVTAGGVTRSWVDGCMGKYVRVPLVRADLRPWYRTTFGGAALMLSGCSRETKLLLLYVTRRSEPCMHQLSRVVYLGVVQVQTPRQGIPSGGFDYKLIRHLRVFFFLSLLFPSPPFNLNLILVLYTVSCMCCTPLLLDFCIVLPPPRQPTNTS
ncbi:hypothetical protein J3E68DRAFT_124651 [Trichoderma sp. SZMC 28012]